MANNRPESGFQSGYTQKPAQKPKEPKQTQPQRSKLTARESATRDVVSNIQLILNNSVHDVRDEEPVGAGTQSPMQQGKSNYDRSGYTEEQRQMMNTMSREEIMAVVPQDENGQPTSIGSMLHASAACKVCAFTAKQCKTGLNCPYCHLKHSCKQRNTRRNRMRMGKSQRERVKETVEALFEQIQSEPSLDLDHFDMPEALSDWADVIKTRLRIYQDAVLTEQHRISL